MSVAIVCETILNESMEEFIDNSIMDRYEKSDTGYDWTIEEEYLLEQNENLDEVEDLLFKDMVMKYEGYDWEEELFKARPKLRHYDYKRACENALAEGSSYVTELGTREDVSLPTWQNIEFLDE